MVINFKKKQELPTRPILPTKHQIIQDITEASQDDPVFREVSGNRDSKEQSTDGYCAAKKFVGSTDKLKSLSEVLDKQKLDLEENKAELLEAMKAIEEQQRVVELK